MPEAEEKHPGGRPTKYQGPGFPTLEQIQILAEEGFTNSRFADYLGISRATVQTWLNEHSEFLDAIQKGREIADHRVKESLFKLANGFTHTQQKVAGKDAEVVEYEEYFPPVPVAAFFWLCNRRPEHWKHKQTIINEGGEIRPLAVQVVTNQADANKIEAAFEVLEGGALPAPGPAPDPGKDVAK